MLTPHEISAGEMRSAKPLSLIRPLAAHDREVLVAGSSDNPIAVILDGEFAYRHFATAGTDGWTGLIVPELRLEVDEESAFDARFERAAPGAVVRREAELSLCVSRERGNGAAFVTLMAELPSIGDFQAGFLRWQLVLGDVHDKRIIRKFDVSQPDPRGT